MADEVKEITPFIEIYRLFEAKATDDMYMEMTREETENAMYSFLIQAIPFFEFPRNDLEDYEADENGHFHFNCKVTNEEKNILAVYMLANWFTQQLATVDLTRMKYSGQDFKFTSQANHISKLAQLKEKYEKEGFHLQRVYKRRGRDSKGSRYATVGNLMESSIGKRYQ